MATKLQIYKCTICGNIVEVLHGGGGQLICCGRPMDLFKENTTDAAKEKHVPVVEKTAEGYTVTVGSTLHPMTEDHSIEWIELLAGDKAYRVFLNPGDSPTATFQVDANTVEARAYCNLHGLWKGAA